MREKLAALCHDQWAGWMRYLFSKCTYNPDGTVTMPKWAVSRWGRQVITPYDKLSKREKDQDLEEADRFLKIFNE